MPADNIFHKIFLHTTTTVALAAVLAVGLFSQSTTQSAASGSIQLTAPNGGNCFTPGGAVTVTWSGSGFDHVALAYRMESEGEPPSYGTNPEAWNIATAATGSTYSWTVPATVALGVPVKLWAQAHDATHTSLGLDSSDSALGFAATCGTTGTTPSATSCPSDVAALLGSGCHTMDSAYFNGEMTQYVLVGTTASVNCSTAYRTGCTTGGSGSASCASGYTWNGTACVVSTNTSSCPSDVAALLGDGCHNMGSTYFDSYMTRYVVPGTTVVKSCTTEPYSGCSTGNTAYLGDASSCPGFAYSRWDSQGRRYCQLNAERRCDYNYPSYLANGSNYTEANCPTGDQSSCSSGYYWNGSSCVLSTTNNQREQTWNSLGLRSWVRSDADAARIEQLRTACVNVPASSNVWLPNAGTSTSVDFGMPSADKCRLAASCSASQYFDGAACTTSGAGACPSGQYWTGSACATSGDNWGNTNQTCDSALITLLGNGCHYMYNDSNRQAVFCDGAMTRSARRGDTATATGCQSTSNQTSGGNWISKTWTFRDGTESSYILNRTDTEYQNYVASIDAQCRLINRSQFTWKPNAGNDSAANWQNFGIPECSGSANTNTTATQREQTWNSLGLRSWVRSDADAARIEQLRTACVNVPASSNVWLPNAGTSTSVDFGMPSADKCRLAASCSASQYFDGAACTTSGAGACPSGQYWTGSACATSPTTSVCPNDVAALLGSGCHEMSEGYFNGEMTRYVRRGATAATGCTTTYASGCTVGTTSSSATYPFRFAGSGRTCTSYQECFEYCKTTPGSGTGDPATCDRYFPGATTSATSACPSDYHVAYGATGTASHCVKNTNAATCQPLGGGTTYACPSVAPTTTPAEWREVVWNSLGLRSYVSVQAPAEAIEAARKKCANTPPRDARWPNPSDFSRPETAGIPDCPSSTDAVGGSDRSGTITGTVTDEAGRPAVNVRIGAYQPRTNQSEGAATDADGRYAITLGAGSWFIGVWASSSGVEVEPPREVVVQAGRATSQNLRVRQPAATVNGVVKDENGATLEDFSGFVYLEAVVGQSGGGAPVTGGRFTLRLAPGTRRLVLDTPQGAPWSLVESPTVTVAAGERREVALIVRRHRSEIKGKVVAPDGQPVTGLNLQVVASGRNGAWRETTVNTETGGYALTISAGTWFVRAAPRDDSRTSALISPTPDLAVTVTEGQTLQQNIVFQTTNATIAGTVIRPDGTPAANVWVAVGSQPFGPTTHETADRRPDNLVAGGETDGAGSFTIAVPAGSYFIRAFAGPTHGLINPEERSVTVGAGQRAAISLRFRAPETSIRGTVRRGGQPAEGFVYAWSATGGYLEARSGADGTYRLSVTPDTWRLAATGKHEDVFYRSTSVSVTTSAGSQIATADLVLEAERPLPPPAATTVAAGASSVVNVEDGTSVRVPASGLGTAGPATITVNPDAQTPQQGATQAVGVAYEVNAFNAAGDPITKFDAPLTITIPYDPNDLTARGVRPNDLTIGFWDEATGTVRQLPTSVVNADARTVTATVDHLTRFFIVAAADVIPPSAPTEITAATAAGRTITLRWQNPARDFSHAKVYRSSEPGRLGQVLATDLTTASYVDAAAAPGAAAYYTVRAVDPSGNESTNTEQVAAAAPAAATTAPPASALARRLAGRILLQVEQHGEAWYVSPKDSRRYFLGRPADAFAVMRTLGEGITDANLEKISAAATTALP